MNKLDINLIFLVYKYPFSQHYLAGFVGSASGLGCETLDPSLAESHPYPNCFSRPQDASSIWHHLQRHNLGQPFKNWRPNPRGTQIQRHIPTHVTGHSHWSRGRDRLNHCSSTHSTGCCTGTYGVTARFRRWCCYPSTQPGRIQRTLPPKACTSTLAWRNKTFGLMRVPSGKAS